MERDVIADILKEYRRRGAYAVKIHGGPHQPRAVDIYACYRGVFIAIEAKRDHGIDATPRQKETLREVAAAKGMTVIAHDLKEATDVLDAVDKRFSRWQRIIEALRAFARLGNPLGYPRRPKRLDVPFEWYEEAFNLIGDGN